MKEQVDSYFPVRIYCNVDKNYRGSNVIFPSIRLEVGSFESYDLATESEIDWYFDYFDRTMNKARTRAKKILSDRTKMMEKIVEVGS